MSILFIIYEEVYCNLCIESLFGNVCIQFYNLTWNELDSFYINNFQKYMSQENGVRIG